MTMYPATFETLRGIRLFYLGTFGVGALAGVIGGLATVIFLTA
jgi:hypothetical protein